MSEIDLNEKKVKNRICLSVKWRGISIGLVFEESPESWRISDDLKGEFWALADYNSKDLAIEALIQKKQALDDFRINQISTQK